MINGTAAQNSVYTENIDLELLGVFGSWDIKRRN